MTSRLFLVRLKTHSRFKKLFVLKSLSEKIEQRLRKTEIIAEKSQDQEHELQQIDFKDNKLHNFASRESEDEPLSPRQESANLDSGLCELCEHTQDMVAETQVKLATTLKVKPTK